MVDKNLEIRPNDLTESVGEKTQRNTTDENYMHNSMDCTCL